VNRRVVFLERLKPLDFGPGYGYVLSPVNTLHFGAAVLRFVSYVRLSFLAEILGKFGE
jgi:hypothetical protein